MYFIHTYKKWWNLVVELDQNLACLHSVDINCSGNEAAFKKEPQLLCVFLGAFCFQEIGFEE